MPQVIVQVPDIAEAILEAIQKQFVDVALEVALQVPNLLKDAAMLDKQDVDGNTMPDKQPRPKGDPTNYPDIPCFDTGEMMSNERFTIEQVSDTQVDIIYNPPEYLEYLIEKAPEAGGRRWITPDQINKDVLATIEEKMAVALRTGDSNEPTGWQRQGVPEGFEL